MVFFVIRDTRTQSAIESAFIRTFADTDSFRGNSLMQLMDHHWRPVRAEVAHTRLPGARP